MKQSQFFYSSATTILEKSRETDSGYDLEVIEKVKQINATTAMYDTGVSVQPPDGVYFDLVPRSSIYKSGYIMYNSPGIIDNEYRGTIKVVLVKIDESARELELPCRLLQLVPRKVIDLKPVLVSKNYLSDTTRGDKGFGSSG